MGILTPFLILFDSIQIYGCDGRGMVKYCHSLTFTV